MTCQAIHTQFQCSDAEFKCPECEKSAEDEPQGLVIYENNDDTVDPSCSDLHPDDYLLCHDCGYETNGRAFSNYMLKKQDLVPCPCCKGKGTVPSGKAKRWKAKSK